MTVALDVKILDRTFEVNCSEEEYARLKPAVEYVNEQFKEIATSAKTVNVERIAVMAALNLAYELLSMNASEGFDLVAIQRKIKTMTVKLDDMLKHQDQLFK